MDGEHRKGVSERERASLTLAALLPAALALTAPMALRGGRLCWLGPVLALPVGIWLCRLWRKLGRRDLSAGLEEAFGVWAGKLFGLLYLLWGLFLLILSARQYADRLLTGVQGQAVQWLFLGTALALALWLGRGDGTIFARAGRLFFWIVAAALAFALLLALPALDWRNLWPPAPEDWTGLLEAGVLALSLSGYGVYVLCLPAGETRGERTWIWPAWGCAVFALVLLAVVGTFGPALTARMEEPFLFLLEGVKVPGAFRRGDASLAAILGLGDLVLLILLVRGCRSLWKGMIPSWKGRGGAAVCIVAFCAAGLLSGRSAGQRAMEQIAPAGNLLFGVLLPAFSVLMGKLRRQTGKQSTFCGQEIEARADIGEKEMGEKS